MLTRTGQNISCPPRPRQNPFSSLEPPICKIHRLLVRCSNRHERHLQRGRDSRALSRPFSHNTPHLPLRCDQIPSIRADTVCSDQGPRTRDAHSQTRERQHGRRDISLLHLSPRSNPRPTSLRNETLLPLLPLRNLSPYLLRKLARTPAPRAAFIRGSSDGSPRRERDRAALRPREFLSRFLGYDDGHAAVCGNVVSNARHSRRSFAPSYNSSLHHTPQIAFIPGTQTRASPFLGGTLRRWSRGPGISDVGISVGSH
jgi:hypothetical protein